MVNAQRCKLFYTLLHFYTRNCLWCQSSCLLPKLAELMVFERQVRATIHFSSFALGSPCHKNMFGLFGQTSLTYDDGQGE